MHAPALMIYGRDDKVWTRGGYIISANPPANDVSRSSIYDRPGNSSDDERRSETAELKRNYRRSFSPGWRSCSFEVASRADFTARGWSIRISLVSENEPSKWSSLQFSFSCSTKIFGRRENARRRELDNHEDKRNWMEDGTKHTASLIIVKHLGDLPVNNSGR